MASLLRLACTRLRLIIRLLGVCDIVITDDITDPLLLRLLSLLARVFLRGAFLRRQFPQFSEIHYLM